MSAIRIYFIEGRGTKEEMEARKKAITSGEELLPDGTKYQDTDNVKLMWDTIEEFDPFFNPFFKMSKVLLDIKPRRVGAEELALPLDLALAVNKHEIEIAIQGGLDSVSLNFNEGRILQALSHALDERSFPVEFHLTRPQLFKYIGPDMSGREKERIQKTIIQLSRKTFPFVFRQFSRKDPKTGEPLYRVALTYAPLFVVASVYEDIKQLELPDVLGPKVEKRFSHYVVRFNKNAIGVVENYFCLLPSRLPLEIVEFRRARNQKPRSFELSFIEYLYQENHEVIEINYLKLAKKLHVKMKSPTMHSYMRRNIRAVLDRCYETAIGLNFAVEILKDQPAGKGITKEIIRLNPERFPYIAPKGKSW